MNIDEVNARGKAIYQRLIPQLTAYAGQFVAIEPESGGYVVAATLLDAITQSRARYPGKLFYTVQIGSAKGTIAGIGGRS